MPTKATKAKQKLAVRIASPNCWLCGGKINLALRSPHPMSYTADHVLPKYLFGENGETRPAHRCCNERKGTKIPTHFPTATRQPTPPLNIERAARVAALLARR